MSGCWLCPLRSISANASACFSLHLRSARYIGDLAGYGQKVTLTGLLTAHTALLKSHCRGDNAHSYACVRLFSPRNYESILRGFYNAVSLPGDCHASYASFLTSQSSQATIASLMLAYSFSPKVQKYLLGSPFFRSQ